MKLYLVRHGTACSPHEDPEQRLAKEGRAEVGRVVAFLAPKGLSVRAIWQSGKARAKETAEILAPAFNAEGKVTQQSGLAPGDPVKTIRDRIEAFDNDLMLVGHLPFMPKLTSLLLTGDQLRQVVEFQTATVVCLEQSDPTSWHLSWVINPDLLP